MKFPWQKLHIPFSKTRMMCITSSEDAVVMIHPFLFRLRRRSQNADEAEDKDESREIREVMIGMGNREEVVGGWAWGNPHTNTQVLMQCCSTLVMCVCLCQLDGLITISLHFLQIVTWQWAGSSLEMQGVMNFLQLAERTRGPIQHVKCNTVWWVL